MLKQETYIQQLLNQLRTKLLVMFATTSISLDEAIAALNTGNIGRANAVLEDDDKIDELDKELDELALNLLVRVQPMASDLRFVLATLRIVTDLERMGDEAVVIAERVLTTQGEFSNEMTTINIKLINLARTLVADVITAFKDGNSELALKLCCLEDEISQAEVAVLHEIMDQISCSDNSQAAYVDMHSILICRALNRICRHAVNIAEQVYFINKGTSIKHKKLC